MPLKLAELDRSVVRAVLEGDLENLGRALGAYVGLRKSLKARLLRELVISAGEASAAGVLRKIACGEGLPSDEVLERLSLHLGENDDIGALDEEEIEQLGSELFYSWFSHHEYIRGLAELRPLILGVTVPDSVSRLVAQARDCYAFQQYDATYALCRMVIEACVRDICMRRQLFPDLGKDVVLFEKHKWQTLRDKVSSGALRERLRILYADLSSVIHSRKSVSKEEARAAFEEALLVVECLYAESGL